MDVRKIKQQTLQHLPDLLCVQVQEGSKLQGRSVHVQDLLTEWMEEEEVVTHCELQTVHAIQVKNLPLTQMTLVLTFWITSITVLIHQRYNYPATVRI